MKSIVNISNRGSKIEPKIKNMYRPIPSRECIDCDVAVSDVGVVSSTGLL